MKTTDIVYEAGYRVLKDGEWWHLRQGVELLEACCDCGLVHKVRYKRVGNKFFQQNVVDDKETKRVRKETGKHP